MAQKRVARIDINVGTLLHAERPVDVKASDMQVGVMGYFYEGTKNEGDFRKDVTSLLNIEQQEQLAAIVDDLLNKVEEQNL